MGNAGQDRLWISNYGLGRALAEISVKPALQERFFSGVIDRNSPGYASVWPKLLGPLYQVVNASEMVRHSPCELLRATTGQRPMAHYHVLEAVVSALTGMFGWGDFELKAITGGRFFDPHGVFIGIALPGETGQQSAPVQGKSFLEFCDYYDRAMEWVLSTEAIIMTLTTGRTGGSTALRTLFEHASAREHERKIRQALEQAGYTGEVLRDTASWPQLLPAVDYATDLLDRCFAVTFSHYRQEQDEQVWVLHEAVFRPQSASPETISAFSALKESPLPAPCLTGEPT